MIIQSFYSVIHCQKNQGHNLYSDNKMPNYGQGLPLLLHHHLHLLLDCTFQQTQISAEMKNVSLVVLLTHQTQIFFFLILQISFHSSTRYSQSTYSNKQCVHPWFTFFFFGWVVKLQCTNLFPFSWYSILLSFSSSDCNICCYNAFIWSLITWVTVLRYFLWWILITWLLLFGLFCCHSHFCIK